MSFSCKHSLLLFPPSDGSVTLDHTGARRTFQISPSCHMSHESPIPGQPLRAPSVLEVSADKLTSLSKSSLAEFGPLFFGSFTKLQHPKNELIKCLVDCQQCRVFRSKGRRVPEHGTTNNSVKHSYSVANWCVGKQEVTYGPELVSGLLPSSLK